MQEKYLKLKLRLAQALGWKELEVDGDQVWGWEPDGSWAGNYRATPDWTHDHAASFQLMLDYDIRPVTLPTHCTSKTDAMPECCIEQYADHPNKETAARCVILRAATAHLEALAQPQTTT